MATLALTASPGPAWAPVVPGVRVREHRWLHGRGQRRRHLVRHRLRRRGPDPGARGSGHAIEVVTTDAELVARWQEIAVDEPGVG